ncbi:hypothetical protein BpHYR1_029262 [Brachionus plicatilis]|uniref:Uncharacterized protein n=1 Tax=Brachionus plicatilis TaxID=10195 RepID=A0A3M7P7S0_BRAPC|nr:hypothetical protein BpHYR1_029262 [Brachionus plicatilis]
MNKKPLSKKILEYWKVFKGLVMYNAERDIIKGLGLNPRSQSTPSNLWHLLQMAKLKYKSDKLRDLKYLQQNLFKLIKRLIKMCENLKMSRQDIIASLIQFLNKKLKAKIRHPKQSCLKPTSLKSIRQKNSLNRILMRTFYRFKPFLKNSLKNTLFSHNSKDESIKYIRKNILISIEVVNKLRIIL